MCNIGSVTILVNGSILENVESFSYLGVTLSSNMNWSEHVDNLCSKISKRLKLLKRIKHLLPHRARLLFYNSLVLPLFDYGDLVWGNEDNTMLMENRLILQNKAAKVVLDHSLHSSTTDALTILEF